MPQKNSLSALKKATAPPILPAQADTNASAKPADRSIGGRPPLPPSEKRSQKVQISLTPSEKAKLKEKAGLAGEATFIYAKLKELGVFN